MLPANMVLLSKNGILFSSADFMFMGRNGGSMIVELCCNFNHSYISSFLVKLAIKIK